MKVLRNNLTPAIGLCLVLTWFYGCSASKAPSDQGSAPDSAVEVTQDLSTPAPDTSIPDVPVDQPGPFNVGYRTMSIIYMPPAVTEARTIELHIWYPTHADSGETAVYRKAFKDLESFVDAPLAPPRSPAGYPVHIYSHGDRGFGPTSSFLMRHFASHGWVSVAPDHTMNTISDNVEPKPMSIYFLRGMDIIATLDALDFLSEDDPMRGLLRTKNVFLSGHSFGSHTCWSVAGATFDMDLIPDACSGIGSLPSGECSIKELGTFQGGLRDTRVTAAMSMAGTIKRSLFGPDGHQSVEIPMLFMSGTLDPVGAEEHFEECDGVDLTWLELEGACHQAFALGFCEELESEEGFKIINTYALAFARKHVLGLNEVLVEEILDGSYVVSDKVSFKKKP